MIMIITLFSISLTLSSQSGFLTKLLMLGILFSPVVNAFFVAKLFTSGILFPNSVSFDSLTKSDTLGIFFFNSVLSALYLTFKTKSLVSIAFTLATNLSHTVYLTTSFLQHYLVYSNQALICQCLVHLLQFLNYPNLFLMQNLKYQHVKYF